MNAVLPSILYCLWLFLTGTTGFLSQGSVVFLAAVLCAGLQDSVYVLWCILCNCAGAPVLIHAETSTTGFSGCNRDFL